MSTSTDLSEALVAVRSGRRPAVIWGAGEAYRTIRPMIDFPVELMVDRDPAKREGSVHGAAVAAPEALAVLAQRMPVVFICSLDPNTAGEIARQLARIGQFEWYALDYRSEHLYRLAADWVEREPGSIATRLAFGRVCQLANRSSIWPEAVQAFEWVVAQDPSHAEALFQLGILQAHGGNDLEAVRRFRHLLRLAPAHARAHLGLSESLANLGDLDGARAHVREAAALSPEIAAQSALDLADLDGAPSPKRKVPVARYPTKAELDEDLRACIRAKILSPFDDGDRFLRPSTRIFTIGSCFATNIARALGALGYDARLLNLGETINSTFANRYLLDWITGQPMPPTLAERIESLVATISCREKLVQDLAGSEVCIFTLGVAPCFFDSATGAFVMPRPSALNTRVLAGQYLFRTTTVAENGANVLQMIRAVRCLNPSMRICLTVSPVPLVVSFEQKSPVQADCLSKSTLRVAVNEVLQVCGPGVFYWPSFEIVRWLGGHIDPVFGVDDGNSHHVAEKYLDMIMELFVQTFAV